jgi:hypothetical protein
MLMVDSTLWDKILKNRKGQFFVLKSQFLLFIIKKWEFLFLN